MASCSEGSTHRAAQFGYETRPLRAQRLMVSMCGTSCSTTTVRFSFEQRHKHSGSSSVDKFSWCVSSRACLGKPSSFSRKSGIICAKNSRFIPGPGWDFHLIFENVTLRDTASNVGALAPYSDQPGAGNHRRLNSSRVSIRFRLRTLAKTGSGQARREAETNGAFY